MERAACRSHPSPRTCGGEGSGVGAFQPGSLAINLTMLAPRAETFARDACLSMDRGLQSGVVPPPPTPPHRKSGWERCRTALSAICNRPAVEGEGKQDVHATLCPTTSFAPISVSKNPSRSSAITGPRSTASSGATGFGSAPTRCRIAEALRTPSRLGYIMSPI